MKRILVITIDVEPDCSLTWHYSNPLTFAGVTKGIKERLQPLFNKYRIVPTYLINNVVLENSESIEIFRDLEGQYELGTHLHPEFIEPERLFNDYAGRKGERNCCFYPPNIEFEKIRNITTLFVENFGYHPTSFRAGRFSAGNNTIRSLTALGYKIDTSVTPRVIWNDKTREAPVDYSLAKDQPYLMKRDEFLKEDRNGEILQVPVSITLKKTSLLKGLLKSRFGLSSPVTTIIPIWLRPGYSSFKDFISIINDFSTRYKNEEFVVFNMMFHNVEVLPKLSPYTRNENDCKAYLNQMEAFFIQCKKLDFLSLPLTSLYDLYKKK